LHAYAKHLILEYVNIPILPEFLAIREVFIEYKSQLIQIEDIPQFYLQILYTL